MLWSCLYAVRGYLCAVGVLAACVLGLILGAGAPLNRRLGKASSSVGYSAMTEPKARVGFRADRERSRLLSPSSPVHSISTPTQLDPAARAGLLQNYGQLPLSFEVNQGQTNDRVKFLARGSGYTLFLTSEEAVLALRPPTGDGDRLAARKPAVASGKGESDFQPSAVRMKLVGANRSARVRGVEELPGKSNYFLGNDPKKWRTDVPTYAKVKYQDVYPGIDLVYYGSQGGKLEYDFLVAPGADPQAITLNVEAGPQPENRNSKFEMRKSKLGNPTFQVPHRERLHVAPDGDLVIQIDGGELRFHKLVVYQDKLIPKSDHSIVAKNDTQPVTDDARRTSGNSKPEIQNRKSIDSHFILTTSNQVRFAFSPYDHSKPLVIDPVLTYSTYLGAGNTEGYSIAVDFSGNTYVTGATSDFPIVNPLQTLQQSFGGGPSDAFVAKLNAAGSALVYSTYLGGNGQDTGKGIAVDSQGNAYLAGLTCSTNFPTVSALQTTNNAFQSQQICEPGGMTGFVAKLNPTGTALFYATYLGGNFEDYCSGIAVDSSGNTYVAGGTLSTNFPTVNAVQPTYGGGQGDAFVAKLNAAGSSLVYSTFLGGSDYDEVYGIAVDSSGNAYVSGRTSSTNFPTVKPLQANNKATPTTGGFTTFLSKLNAAGSALLYSTYLGGSGNDTSYAIAVDTAGSAYVTGFTGSSDFPTVNAFQPTIHARSAPGAAFVAKLDASGSALVYSTYLGGSVGEFGYGIAVDSSGNAVVVGTTYSTDFPTQNPLQRSFGGGDSDAFVTKLSAVGSTLVYSTYLGGNGHDEGFSVATDSCSNTYVIGQTSSTNFPTANPLQGGLQGVRDAYVAKLSNPHVLGDFDGDCKADVAVFRPSIGTWFVIPSNSPNNFLVQQWGTAGDVPVRGDYDGDGKTDFAVWRPSTGQWFIIPSSNPGTPVVQQWGASGDIPVPGDYDGDGKTDFAVWRPSTGQWFIIPSSNPGTPVVQQWGTSGDTPVPGDYDGDGKTDFAVWRPSTGQWFIIPSSNPGTPIVQQWGTSGDIPVPGDYDGDGKTDFALWRPLTGEWFVIPSSNPSSPIVQQWGTQGDIPVPGDYDGDGKTDFAVWRPSDGFWYVIPSSAPLTFTATQWGTNGDVPTQKPIGE